MSDIPYDLMWEFISAITERRAAVPSFYDGLNAQRVADAVLQSHPERRWVDTPLARRRAVGLIGCSAAGRGTGPALLPRSR